LLLIQNAPKSKSKNCLLPAEYSNRGMTCGTFTRQQCIQCLLAQVIEKIGFYMHSTTFAETFIHKNYRTGMTGKLIGQTNSANFFR
jgi:hypothetical protein